MGKTHAATVTPSQASSAPSRAEVIRLTDDIRRDFQQVAQTFWDIGVKLARVKRERFYAVLGYASFAEYAGAEFGVRLRQVQKMLAVAAVYARTDAVRVGIERGAELISYCNRLPTRPDPGELWREDALIGDKPLSACTVDDIARAKDELVRARALKRAKTPTARRDAARAKAVATAVHAFVRTSDLGRPRVTVREDEVIVRFSRAALARRLLPD